MTNSTSNPVSLALNKAMTSNSGRLTRTTEGNQRAKSQGIRNKMSGIVIKTNPTTTPKGNKTCFTCLIAKRTGSPLPPEHPNCRCKVTRG